MPTLRTILKLFVLESFPDTHSHFSNLSPANAIFGMENAIK